MFKWFKATRRLSELEERLDAVERHLKALSLDSDDLYDRFKRMSGRIAKREERETPEELTPETTTAPNFSRLTPRQKQIQFQLMARRQNGGTQ